MNFPRTSDCYWDTTDANLQFFLNSNCSNALISENIENSPKNCPDVLNSKTRKQIKLPNIHIFLDKIAPMSSIQKILKTYKTSCLDASNLKNIKIHNFSTQIVSYGPISKNIKIKFFFNET